MLDLIRAVESGSPRITLPMLVLHGSADSLAAPEGSQAFINRIGSRDKRLILYPGLYYEVFNEPEKQAVLTEMSEWLDARV